MRDLRTADSATKVLERAADANAMAHRALGLGQRMALLGQLSACLGALATEESKARQEIARAKEYAQWMGGLADEEDELYRSDRRPTIDSTLDNQLGGAAGRRTSTSASHVANSDCNVASHTTLDVDAMTSNANIGGNASAVFATTNMGFSQTLAIDASSSTAWTHTANLIVRIVNARTVSVSGWDTLQFTHDFTRCELQIHPQAHR